MAMLAEPRRKQKWSVDPRNSTWSKDESKFGQKMLEKMGWTKGKGLGAKEQGSTEHIKVQVKNNTLGLGAAINHEDNWIAHQDDFNQILAELNNCHGSGESESPANEEKKSFSLEEKSKSSRKRVHYMKFAKGKDLSCRSDTDLACIFGKREKGKKTTPQEDEAAADSEESEEKGRQSPPNNGDLGNTVTSTLSVSEYFAKRMAELKKSQAKRTESSIQNTEHCAEPADNSSIENSQKSKKRKRNKRDKNVESDFPAESQAEEHQEQGDSPSDSECLQTTKKSKNKKKNKNMHSEIPENENEDDDDDCQQPEEEDENEVKAKKLKKKNKKRKDNTHDHREEEDEERNSPSETEDQKKKKKKKKKQSN
ncbi:PIN2/TERF1-interacting telomerase inhibitor 1 [Rhinophrynus dorsalis]